MKHIIICDDENTVTREWKDKLEAVDHLKDAFRFTPMTVDELQEMIPILENRRAIARGKPNTDDKKAVIDGCDALIVDYDLLQAKELGFLTGENISYLARCYANVGVIVGLNQFYRGNVFELDLQARPESFADLNISDDQLENEGLWSPVRPHRSFKPWQWPIVPDLCERFEKRIASLQGNLDTPITEFFSFPDSAMDFIDREMRAYVSRDSKNIDYITIRQFVNESGQGLAERDEQPDDQQIARIAASRLSVWLERMILPAQSALVDLPHLLERIPSVVGGPEAIANLDTGSWQALPIDQTGELASLGPHRFAREEWLSRAVWWWPAIEAAEQQKELSEPWDFAGLESVFCEDTSNFHDRNSATAFVVGFASPYARRYIAKLTGVAYRPQVRLAE